jgi:hypothetical protein
MNWEMAVNVTGTPPKMEGYPGIREFPTINYGTIDRAFHAGDMYLTCRLTAKKTRGNPYFLSEKCWSANVLLILPKVLILCRPLLIDDALVKRRIAPVYNIDNR